MAVCRASYSNALLTEQHTASACTRRSSEARSRLRGLVRLRLVERMRLAGPAQRIMLLLSLAVMVTASTSTADAQAHWTVAPSPTFDASGTLASDGTVLERPIGGVLTSQGTVLIADALAKHIILLDQRGRFLRRIGRSGEGPGEFRSIEWIGICARDSIVVWDRAGAKLTFLGADGSAARQVRAPFNPGIANRTVTITCSRTGSYALLSLPREPRVVEGQIVRGLSLITVVGPAGEARTLPFEVTSSELVVRQGGGAPRPLGRTTSMLFDGARLLVGTADSGFVAVLSLDGHPVSGVRTASGERALEKGEYETAVNEFTSTLPSPARTYARELLLAQPVPRHTAPYYGLHLDPAGGLWVRTSAPTEAVTRFAIYDREGRQRGSLTLPRPLTVWDVSMDLVLGTYQDDDGEPHVVAYRYQRR